MPAPPAGAAATAATAATAAKVAAGAAAAAAASASKLALLRGARMGMSAGHALLDTGSELLGTLAGSVDSDTGFVTFRTRCAAALASQALHVPPYRGGSGGGGGGGERGGARAGALEISAAPEPRDVCWELLGMPARRRVARSLLSWAAAIGLAVFWAVPSTLIASLAAPEKVAALLGLRALSAWQEQLLSLLAPLALSLLMALLVPVLRALAVREGHARNSRVQASLLRKYFTFLVLQVFLVQVLLLATD